MQRLMCIAFDLTHQVTVPAVLSTCLAWMQVIADAVTVKLSQGQDMVRPPPCSLFLLCFFAGRLTEHCPSHAPAK